MPKTGYNVHGIKHYPLYFYCKHGENDLPWIMKRMRLIPKEHKDKIASRYERIYLDKKGKGKSRKRANTFLNKIAKRFHNEAITSQKRNAEQFKNMAGVKRNS